MYKVMIFLTRKSDASREEFQRWWWDEHAPKARELPGIVKITFNVLNAEDEAIAAGVTFDGIAELWFESAEAAAAGYASEIGKSVAADSVANVAARMRVPVAELVVL